MPSPSSQVPQPAPRADRETMPKTPWEPTSPARPPQRESKSSLSSSVASLTLVAQRAMSSKLCDRLEAFKARVLRLSRPSGDRNLDRGRDGLEIDEEDALLV